MRFTFFIISLLMFPELMLAQQTDSVSRYNLVVGTFNDSWGGGFSQIKDDYRSYGLQALFEAPGSYSLMVNYSGLTDKGLKNTTQRERIDELCLRGGFTLKKNVFGQINILGNTGIYLLNNLGGEALQSSTHKIFGVNEVTLPYSSIQQYNFLLGLTVVSHPLILKRFPSLALELIPSAAADIIPGYFATVNPQLPLVLQSPKGVCFSLAGGYQYVAPYSTNTLLNTIMSVESGPTIEYKLKAGIFYLQWKLFLNSNYSLGTYGINFMMHRTKKAFTTNDLSVELGNMSQGGGYYSKYLWNKTTCLPEHIQFVLYHQFGTYLKRKLANYPKQYGHYQQTCFGFEYNILKLSSSFLIQPYLAAQVGIKKEAVYPGTEYIKSITALSAIAWGEAGVRLKFPGHLIYKNTQWGLALHCNYQYSFSRSNNEVFENTYHLPKTLAYLGGGFFVNLDL